MTPLARYHIDTTPPPSTSYNNRLIQIVVVFSCLVVTSHAQQCQQFNPSIAPLSSTTCAPVIAKQVSTVILLYLNIQALNDV